MASAASDFSPPQLGVGLIYGRALSPLFDAGLDTVAVLELEPQTQWEKVCDNGTWRYRVNEALLDRVAQFPQTKLLHGVGQPLAGTTGDPVPYAQPLRDAVHLLNPPWVSEHLSFNRVSEPNGAVEVGFLLPPKQTPAAARVAAAIIAAYRRVSGRPVAFETGVNYLRRQAGEMDDGEFFRLVAEQSDSGILLDLHNLWCNETNGRSRVLDVIDEMPLERVWEVHLAGGMPHEGYWLDAHSSEIPEPLIDIAAEVIARLPNVGVVNFEVLPEHVGALGLDGVTRQLEELRALWALRPPRTYAASRHGDAIFPPPSAADDADVRAWENQLVAAVRAHSGKEGTPRFGDPGIAIYRGLIEDFRSGFLARTMRYTMTALLAGIGSNDTRELLSSYFASCPPDAYPAVEADHFAAYLAGHTQLLSRVRYLEEVLAFERGLIRATVYGEGSDVHWTVDPTVLLEALDQGRLPGELPGMPSTMRLSTSPAAEPHEGALVAH